MYIEADGLFGGYTRNKNVVKDVAFSMEQGEILGVLGPNGCGKTTLFRLLLGFLPLAAGSICIGGANTQEMTPGERAKLVAYIPQQHTPTFPYTVMEVLLMGRASHFSAFSQPGEVDRQQAFAALEMLNILHFANLKYTELSGGQRQLVLIARAIAQQARVFVMDEPGASLDYANHELLMDVLRELAAQGYSIILSTHSPEHPFSIAHKVLLMHEGRVAAFGPPHQAMGSVLEEVYGIEMDMFTVQDRYGSSHTMCLPAKKNLHVLSKCM